MSFVDWADAYAPVAFGGEDAQLGVGFGGGAEEAAALRKSMMTAGTGQAVVGAQVPGALAPLMPESLEATLKVMTYSEKEFKLWKQIAKVPAYNTTEEYNRLHAVGAGEAGWMAEGDLPEEETSIYSRESALMKFMGTTRRVSHVASIVRTAGIVNAIAQETKNGTLWLMRQLEWGLFNGDASLVPVQFDGLKRLMIAGGSTIYDNRGAALSEQTINDLCSHTRGAPNYGYIDQLWTSIGAKSDLVNLIRANQRAMYGTVVTAGAQIDSIMTQATGKVEILDTVFITEGEAPFVNGVGPAWKRPLSPIIAVQPADAALAGGETSQWAAGDAGNYFYKVVAFNRYGRSAPVTTAVVAAQASRKVVMTVQDGGQDTTGYLVYRSTKGGAATTCLYAVSVAKGAGIQTVITDFNNDIPGTSWVFGIENSPETLAYKQLAPFTRIPLATIDTSIRWMQVLYGAPLVYRPRHLFAIKNVGRASGAVVPAKAFPGYEPVG